MKHAWIIIISLFVSQFCWSHEWEYDHKVIDLMGGGGSEQVFKVVTRPKLIGTTLGTEILQWFPHNSSMPAKGWVVKHATDSITFLMDSEGFVMEPTVFSLTPGNQLEDLIVLEGEEIKEDVDGNKFTCFKIKYTWANGTLAGESIKYIDKITGWMIISENKLRSFDTMNVEYTIQLKKTDAPKGEFNPNWCGVK